MATIVAIAKSHPICHMAIIMAIMFIFLCFVFLKLISFSFSFVDFLCSFHFLFSYNFTLYYILFFCFTINWKKTYERYQIYSLLILINKVCGFQAFISFELSFFFNLFQMLANRTSLSKKPLALKMSTLKKAVAAKGLINLEIFRYFNNL